MSILKIDGVTKRYSNHTALDNVSFEIPKGCIFGLLGPNGAGKTSLIRIITQITGADSGEVYFKGERLKPSHIKDIGYLPEERGLYKKMKVGEQLLYLAQLKGLSKDEAKTRIKEWVDRFEIREWLGKNIEDLSKGMQQKVQFIATVMHEPSLIILDEPFSGFDPINANLIKDEILRLRDRGATIIFSTHRMESVEELCDYIALINRAHKVLDGPVKEIKDAYKTDTFQIIGNGQLMITSPDFEVLEQHDTHGVFRANVKLLNETKPNDLLAYLIKRVEVHSFVELVPSINDIFIRKVTETHHA
ncbi:ABC-2 type transport system ATP-binding protein [Pontibacter aydingkolensis]|uniref:ATP-binding cassette domain-containing protein n=1 Tax=Pontibacter aydingkolensis TaxID=1911536 RepID=A0ABS7CRG9_9BACT|nr:ATP-binding cassette domain-containing protein [Pontibacter aydingkolensis]MBW7466420.1 ATP-binding cassette domain-containing protein [Pontibacter aydingkolensis]